MRPQNNLFAGSQQLVPTPDVYYTPLHDLYLNVSTVRPGQDHLILRVVQSPLVTWIWVGGFILAFGTVYSLIPQRERKPRTESRGGDGVSDQVNNKAGANDSLNNSVNEDVNSGSSTKRLLIVIVVVVALGALLGFGLFTDKNDRSDIASPLVGKEMPAFTMPLFARYQEEYGESFSFAAQEGRPMVINFWASWCAPCLAEAPELQAASEEFGGDVLYRRRQQDQDGNQENTQAFLDRFNLTFPNGRDEQSRVSVDYGIFGLPETFFINANGTLNYKHAGPLTPEILTEQTQALIQ